MRLGTYMERQKPKDGVLNARTLGYAFALHLAAFAFFWGVAKIVFRAPDVIIPIDMTIVPPWAEQTDDPDPDPNPPPKPEEAKPEPKPQVKEPEPKVEKPKVEAVEQVKEKPKKKEKLDLRKNAKLVKTPPKKPEKLDLRKNAKKIEPPPMKKTGKGTAADKPLSPEEFLRKMNEGYRIGARNQLATSEEQRCVSIIAQAIKREWNKESFKWYPGLKPLQVALKLGSGGTVRGFSILAGSGDADVDRTARSALNRLKSIPGLSATFLEHFPEIALLMEPTQGE